MSISVYNKPIKVKPTNVLQMMLMVGVTPIQTNKYYTGQFLQFETVLTITVKQCLLLCQILEKSETSAKLENRKNTETK